MYFLTKDLGLFLIYNSQRPKRLVFVKKKQAPACFNLQVYLISAYLALSTDTSWARIWFYKDKQTQHPFFLRRGDKISVPLELRPSAVLTQLLAAGAH